MTWGQILIAIWMVFMACGVLAVWYSVETTRKHAEELRLGQLVQYKLTMQLLKNVDPDAFLRIKVEVAAEAFAQGLIDLNADDEEH